jgi:hypothetical protein
MMYFSAIATILLPIAALAAPGPITEITPTKLAIRDERCAIVSHDGPVNCRSGPYTSDEILFRFNPGKESTYTCWEHGTDIGGNE